MLGEVARNQRLVGFAGRSREGERDRRVVEITLTPEGRRHLRAGKRVAVELLNSLVEPFSRQEIETLIALLQRMMARLQEAERMTSIPEPQESSRSRRAAPPDAPRPIRSRRAQRSRP